MGGIFKLFDLATFEFQIVRDGLSNWNTVPILSRGLISAELTLGAGAILLYRQRKIFLQMMFVFLMIFSVYLTINILVGTHQENCGCFGEVLKMDSAASLIKNIIMIVILLPAWRFSPALSKKDYFRILPLVVAVFALVFILFPLQQHDKPDIRISDNTPSDTSSIDSNNTSVITQKFRDDSSKLIKPLIVQDSTETFLQKYSRNKSAFSSFEPLSDTKFRFDVGEKLAFLLSLDCEHCQKALKDFTASKKLFQFPPVGILFLGEESQVAAFFSIAGAEYPYKIISPEEFFPFLTKSPPRIFYLVNGNILASLEVEEVEIQTLISLIQNNRTKK